MKDTDNHTGIVEEENIYYVQDCNVRNIDGENENSHEKGIQIKKWFLVFFIPLILLLALCGIEQMLKAQGIQYRSWLDIAISIGFLFLLPFLFFTWIELLLEYLKKRKQKKTVSIITGLLQILMIGIMGFYIPVMGFFCLLTFESTYEVEQKIGDGYIEGTTQEFLGSNSEQEYAYYTKFSFFGKKKYEDTQHIVKMKMEQRYGEQFEVTQAKDDGMASDTWKDNCYVAVPESMPELQVHVMDQDYVYPFLDDYAPQRAIYQATRYMTENCPNRTYRVIYDESVRKDFYGWLHIACLGQEDTMQCAEDVSGILNAIAEDSFTQDQYIQVYVDCYKDKDRNTYENDDNYTDRNEEVINEAFYIHDGKISASDYETIQPKDKLKKVIYDNLKAQYVSLEEKEENIEENRNKKWDENADSKESNTTDENKTSEDMTSEDMTSEETASENTTENIIQEDTQEVPNTSDNSTPEGAYKTLYEALFQSAGDAYQPTYNAKGNFYAVLGVGSEEVDGQMQNYRRTVVYDRESKNGKCLLFVAYKEYTYFDGSSGNTAILNFYAVEKSTGKVVIADKKAWDEVGTAEYREITGE